MATNDWDNINTDDYDLYDSQGVPSPLPGSPDIDKNGHLIIPSDPLFPPSTIENSTMDEDPNNTGPMTQFWETFPISIDINGFIFYYGENTGINLRGPEGSPRYVRYDDLTPEEKAELKGADGLNGLNGRDGIDGQNGVDGLDAYHIWLRDNGYTEQDHPIEDFYDYIAGFSDSLVKAGTGEGSLIVNFGGENSEANGRGSFASGYLTTAGGNYSFTAGLNTRAPQNYQFTIGAYNEGLTNTLFEIGNGTNVTRKNCFSVTTGGKVTASGDIEDGYGNILRNKVDKIDGKSLSTNDFTNTYKNFLDNYAIDPYVTENSLHPVTSSGIYIALENVRTSITSKATMEVADDNAYIPLLSYTPVGEDEYLEKALKCNKLLWNPFLNNLKVGAPNNDIGNNSQFNYIFGNGLTTSSDYQFAIGKYNDNNSGNIFEIGYGTSSLRENVFYVTKTGNVVTNGDITDGSGNTLSGKQDILQYDTIPTQYSTKVMTSGNIYQTLVDVGITPGVGIEIPEITSLQTQINTINTSLTSVTNRVTAIENSLYEITDDTTEEVYLLGINEGELYIKLKYEPTPPEPEPEDDDEEEPET